MGSEPSTSRDIDGALAEVPIEVIKNMLIVDNVGPEVDTEVPAPAVEAPPPPLADTSAILAPAGLLPDPMHGGIILAKVYGVDEEGLKDSKVHHSVRDVLVGLDVLVVNTALTTIMPDLLDNKLLAQISRTLSMDTKYAPTIAPFVVLPPPAYAIIPPQALNVVPIPERLMESTLEVVMPQTVLEKDGEGVAELAQKRYAVEKEVPESAFNQAEPSASDNSGHA